MKTNNKSILLLVLYLDILTLEHTNLQRFYFPPTLLLRRKWKTYPSKELIIMDLGDNSIQQRSISLSTSAINDLNFKWTLSGKNCFRIRTVQKHFWTVSAINGPDFNGRVLLKSILSKTLFERWDWALLNAVVPKSNNHKEKKPTEPVLTEQERA